MFADKEVRREIARCGAFPVRFEGFLDTGGLCDDSMALVCVQRLPADRLRGYAPTYYFDIVSGGVKAGYISLRVGYTKSLFYAGQIGYSVDAPFRGRGYAGGACRLMIPLMRAHEMTNVLITNNPENIASRRVCEKDRKSVV
jgi:hypothetical protein